MRDKAKLKRFASERRQKRVRRTIKGTPEKPRLTIYKSLKHIYAQLVDDLSRKSLLGVSSTTPEVKKLIAEGESKIQTAKKIGLHLANLAKEKGIEKVVFDRNRYTYHGRVKALAEGAREGGLKF
jgi:large subunit ribosomal protein L18